jgi:pimeloyl-ACP methyl ester carboxylesterase
MYEALPAGQLAIVPGTSHLLTMEKSDLVNRLLLEFLAETGPPVTMVPIRRG